MLEGVRAQVARWLGGQTPAPPADALFLAGHEEIRDVARQLARTRTDIDRTLLALRSWARQLHRRLEGTTDALGRGPAASQTGPAYRAPSCVTIANTQIASGQRGTDERRKRYRGTSDR